MATRHTWILGGMLLAGCGILLWTASFEGVAPAATAAKETTQALQTLVHGEVLEGSGAPDARSDANQPSSERTAIPRTEAAHGPVLLVLDAVTRQPVPGAEVFAAEAGDRPAYAAHFAFELLDHVRPVLADAQGLATLPIVANELLVVGRADGRLGARHLTASEAAGATLLLERDHTLRVRVTNIDGEPLPGVPIVLCADVGSGVAPRANTATADNGIATLHHVQLLRLPAVQPDDAVLQEAIRRTMQGASTSLPPQQMLSTLADLLRRHTQAALGQAWPQQALQDTATAAAAGPFADFVVLAAQPQFEPAQARLDAHALPQQPVELRLSAFGSLVVQVTGQDGLPLQNPWQVTITPSPRDLASQARSPSPALGLFLDRLCTLQARSVRSQPTVEVGMVGLGLHFDLRVEFADDDWNWEVSGVQGPLTIGEARVVALRMPAKFALLAGRLVGADSQPMAALPVTLLVTGMYGRIEGEQVTTGDDGRFVLPVEITRPAAPYTLEAQAELAGQTAGTWVTLPNLQPGQRHDLGDVPLTVLPTLAHGTITDDRGAAIADAKVAVQTFRPGAGPQGAWRAEGQEVQTRADGSYRLLGPPRPQRLRLHAAAGGHAAVASAEFMPGQRVDLALDRLGSIVGSGEVAAWLPRRVLRVRTTGPTREPNDQRLRADDEGRFRLQINDLPAGSYDVEILLRGVPAPLALVRGVTVEPGSETADQRLQNLTLAGQAFRYVVRAVDRAGAPIADPGSPLLVGLMTPNGRRSHTAFAWRDGRVEFAATEPSVPVVALCSGHRPVQAEIVPGDSTLTLDQLQPVEVVLPGLRQLVGPRTQVRVSLVFEGDTGLPMHDLPGLEQTTGRERGYARAALGKSSGAYLGRDDRVRMPLMFGGRYQVVLRISDPAVEGGPVSQPIGAVEVGVDGPEVQSVALTPPSSLVAAALAELAARAPRQR